METKEHSKWWSSMQLNAVRARMVLLIAFQNKGNGHKLNHNETFFMYNGSMLTAFFLKVLENVEPLHSA
jgi:hypothetical protein